MFSHFRFAPTCTRTCSRLPYRICTPRSISYTPSTRSELGPEPTGENEQVKVEDPLEQFAPESENESKQPETYNEFMQSIGMQFRLADGSNKWLGDGVPFPMNPSFKPPIPVSDKVRAAIYRRYMSDPIGNDVRVLAQQYHMSLKRIDAILRLKGMEEDWKKGTPLQSGFLRGMEDILAVKPPKNEWNAIEGRKDVHEADMLEQEERRDAARQRYQQLYWESVPEDGREPIIPASLEHAKATAKRYAQAREVFKSNPTLMPRVKDETTRTPKEKVQIITKAGRPSTKFVDVGGHFIEVEQRLKRLAESKRRARIKARKAEEQEAAAMKRKATRS